jgi:hypothetical protein
VLLAYRKLFRCWPDFGGLLCIVLHDTPGYWGCADIDGKEGKNHPLRGAMLVGKIIFYLNRARGRSKLQSGLLAVSQAHRCALHSGSLARAENEPPSDICWADKYSIFCEPEWFYLLRARLSGEIDEFSRNAVLAGQLDPHATNREWLHWFKKFLLSRGEIRDLLLDNSIVRHHYLLRQKIACSLKMVKHYEKTHRENPAGGCVSGNPSDRTN